MGAGNPKIFMRIRVPGIAINTAGAERSPPYSYKTSEYVLPENPRLRAQGRLT